MGISDYIGKIICGDCAKLLATLPDESVDSVITSPPYWGHRDYGVEGQLGLESTMDEYVKKLCDIFDDVKRALKPSGTCWVNLGDTYKEKRLCMIPSRFAIMMGDRGWILRNEIIWHKRNCMPDSSKDRFTVDFEKIFFFVKNQDYFFDPQYEPMAASTLRKASTSSYIVKKGKSKGKTQLAINHEVDWKPSDKGRNKRCVWDITTKGLRDAHFATFPEDLVEPMVKAGCPENGIVMDIFMGAGTTGLVAEKLNRKWIGIELNPEYIKMAEKRIAPEKIASSAKNKFREWSGYNG